MLVTSKVLTPIWCSSHVNLNVRPLNLNSFISIDDEFPSNLVRASNKILKSVDDRFRLRIIDNL